MIFSSLVALATASVPYQIEISRAVTTLAVPPPPPIHETRRERPAAEPAGPQILGIGTLDLKAVLPVLRKIVQSGKGYDQFYLELGVVRDGSIARCKGEWTPRRQSPLVGEVCAAFEKFSHYEFPAGFVLPAKTGYVGVEFETFNPPSIAPDILPAKKDASTEVHMQIDPTSPFPIERCTQYSRAIPKALAERICAKIVQLPQFNQWQQSNAWAANVKIWLKPAAVPLRREILVSEYRNDAIPSYIFPEGLHANARLMPATAGKFTMEMTEYDYPPRALREGMTGISTIAIGISPYGIIESCTPQVSSGFLLLDLGACDLVRKNGVFTNSDEVKRDDVRYVLRRIRWQ